MTAPSPNPIVMSGSVVYGFEGLGAMDFDSWLALDEMQKAANLPLGLALTFQDAGRLSEPLRAQLTALDVPIIMAEAGALLPSIIGWYEARHRRALQLIGDLRAGNAEIRAEHARLQSSFAEVENWMYQQLAPRFVCLRRLPASAKTFALAAGAELNQPLMVASEGLVAADITLRAGSGLALEMKLTRADGSEIDRFRRAVVGPDGAVRFALDRAVGGFPEDCALVVRNSSAEAVELALTLPYPGEEFAVRQAGIACERPIALTLWAGLGDVRLPDLSAGHVPMAGRYLMPTDLPEADVLAGFVRLNPASGALEIRPDAKGVALIVFREFEIGEALQIEAYLQFVGDGGAVVTFAASESGAIKAQNEAYRLPTGQYCGAADYSRLRDVAGCALTDVIVRMENAHPGAALWLWALRLGQLDRTDAR